MASTNYMFGWDLLHKTIENDLTCEAELIIAIVHWYLVKNTNLLCLGTGNERQIQNDEVGSELLPANWNANPNSFSLRYSDKNNAVFVVIGTVVQESIIINFMSSESLETSNVAFHITNTVKQFKEPINKAIPDLPTLLDRLKKELVDPIITKNVKTTETQTQAQEQNVESSSRFSHLIDPSHGRQPFGYDPYRSDPLRNDPLRNVGRNDLDPFGGIGGGGMLFDPPRGGIDRNFPQFGGGIGGVGNRPPNIPPGARFDPINPLGPLRRMNPDNDHFRPPGNYDDMFM